MRDTLLFNIIWTLLALLGVGLLFINVYLAIAVGVVWTIFFYWQVGYSKGNKRPSNKQSYKHRSK